MKFSATVAAVLALLGRNRLAALSFFADTHKSGLNVLSPDDMDLGTATINQIENQIISFARMTEKSNMTTATQDMRAFVSIFRNKIDGKMIPYLHNQTRMSKENVDAKYTRVEECATTRNYGAQKTQRQNNKILFSVTLTNEHYTCRTKQAQDLKQLNDNKADRKTKTDARKKLCDLKEETEKFDPDITACDEGGTRDGATGLYEKMAKLVREYNSIKEDCIDAKKQEKEQIDKVKGLQDLYDKRTAECDTIQRKVMKAQCDYRLNTFAHEVEYIGCYQEAKNAYEDATWRAGKSMLKRKHEYRALQRIKCLLVGLADGNVGRLNQQIIYCRAQRYSGNEMVFAPKKTPQQKNTLPLVETPCKTRKMEADPKYWMKKIPVPLLIPCTECELPPTPKPTPVPTPPPPPGKVRCQYKVKEEMVNVRYNNTNVKLVGTRMWPSWHNFEMKYESGQGLELEAKGTGSGDSGTVALKCTGVEKVGAWTEYDIKEGFVIVTGGTKQGDYDKPATTPRYAKYKDNWGAWYPAMSTPYVKMVVGPDYDTTCWTSADNEIQSILYGGQVVGMQMEKEGTQPDMKQAFAVKVFKFNFVVNSTIEVIAKNIPSEEQNCAFAGFGLVCKSAWPQWEGYSTEKGNVLAAPSKDGKQFGKLEEPCSSTTTSKWTTIPSVPKPPGYVWSKDGSGPWAKFIIKGNLVKA